MKTLAELTQNLSLRQNLARNLFINPTPVQAQSIPHAQQGLDVVATAQTGTGKTLAFLVPLIEKLLGSPVVKEEKPRTSRVAALILVPTRELAIQIAESFQKLTSGTELRAAVVVGGLSEQTQLSALKRGAQVVIATPGRLEDFLNRRLVDLGQVQTAVLDEADRMLDMGFLPAIEKILGTLPKNRQSLFFSATMDRTVERLIQRHSKTPVRVAIETSVAKTPEQVDLHLYELESDLRVGLLRNLLTRQEGSFLVFARTKHGTDRLAKRLSASGTRAVAMHGDRTQNQRNQALAGFRDGRYRVLVATDVAARGIHVDSVAHVVNFDLPQAPMDFIHRVGRTGRAGQRGMASTFSTKAERGEINRIERECKIRLVRRELSPAMLSEFAIEPEHKPFIAEAEIDEKAPAPKAKRAHGPKGSNRFKSSSKPKFGKKTFAKKAAR